MGRYWKTSMQYSQISVGELQRKAQQSVNNAKSKGKEMHPIVIEGRQIAKAGGVLPGVRISNNMQIILAALHVEKDM